MGGDGSKRARGQGLAVFLAAATLLWALVPCRGQSLHPLLNKTAPPFTIESGDGRRLTLDLLKGKVAVIFYETRDASEKNSDIKDRLNGLYDRQEDRVRQSIVRVPVFNCSRVFWPITLVWKEGLRKHSRKVGMTLYGDWDGKMAADYQMRDRESNVVILDRAGTVRYVSSGRISEEEFHGIEELLDRLVNLEH